MFISEQKRNDLSKVIEVISDTHTSSAELRQKAGRAMLDLVGGDMCASYEWSPVSKEFKDGISINMSANHVDRYLSHFQYRNSERMQYVLGRPGARLVSDVISHDDLQNSEIYTELLRPEGHKFGINLTVFDGPTYLADLRIWRSGGSCDFSQSDVTMLELLGPALANAHKRTTRAQSKELSLSAPTILGLTAREMRVAGLVADGLSDKEIARQLGVSFATVRTHLNNAFKKLGTRNRTELATAMHNVPTSKHSH